MQKLEGKLESILKGAYAHFMQKEICEQPESLAATLAGRVKRVRLRRANRLRRRARARPGRVCRCAHVRAVQRLCGPCRRRWA